MKMPALTITTVLLLLSASVFAQAGEYKPVETEPTATKGYYAIGNNAKKLAKEGTPSARTASPQKGYYALAKKRKKTQTLPTGNYLGAKQPRHYVRPVVIKGYYAIGRNTEKL